MTVSALLQEVEVVDVVVTESETHEPPDFQEFRVPTAQELGRLIYRGAGDCLSTATDEQNNLFARLLNRGSSLD